nr:MAG TPA: hypothetical protein [Caudoviricetes sp.]
MKAIKVALFFEMMKNMMIQYSCDELQGTTFRSHFGAVGLGMHRNETVSSWQSISQTTQYHRIFLWIG